MTAARFFIMALACSLGLGVGVLIAVTGALFGAFSPYVGLYVSLGSVAIGEACLIAWFVHVARDAREKR